MNKITTIIRLQFAFLLVMLAGQASIASASIIASYDFETGAQGWTVGTTNIGGLNSWALGTSLPGTAGQALPSTWWTNPNFGSLGFEESYVVSPTLVSTGTMLSIAFDSYSSNEGGYPDFYDVEHIQLAINGGAFADTHGSLDSTLHSSNDQTFRSFMFDTSGLAIGDIFQYRFLYDTGDGCCGPIDISGWAFDNVIISGATSVPVPATLALFGLGLAGLGWSRRKKA